MINPFIISGKIPNRFFCDRQEESSQIKHLLSNQNNILLISPRRMGKTALINHVFMMPEFSEEYYTFYLDILQTTSLKEFTYLLGKTIYDALLPKYRRIAEKFISILKSINGKLSYDPLTNAPSFNFGFGEIQNPQYTLEEIFSFLEKTDKRCIIAIDEFQQIANYPQKNVEALLRTHIQQLSNCNFIFAGSRRHMLQKMFLDYSRPFYHSATLMTLDPIPKDVFAEFVERLFKEYQKEIDPEDVYKIYDVFDGYTFYMQRILNHSFSITSLSEKCTLDILRDSLQYILNVNAPEYREILVQLPESQKELLIAIAKEKNVEHPTSGAFIRKYGLKSASSVQGALKKLMDIDMVTSLEGHYAMSDKFLALWVMQTYGVMPDLF